MTRTRYPDLTAAEERRRTGKDPADEAQGVEVGSGPVRGAAADCCGEIHNCKYRRSAAD
jgi:hypothetical protein